MYDLLIRGGTVIDAALGLNEVRDVAIADGKIAAIEDSIDGGAREVVDAAGLIVTPGLIDMHMHAYWGVCCYGLEPDAINIARGVTTAMDCGSAGARTFPHFRRTVMERADTRLYALLNISAMGIISPAIGELFDMRWARVEDAGEMGRQNRDLVLGVKVRLSHHTIFLDDKLDALKRAIAAAEMFGGLVMVHVGDIETPLETLTRHLRPGDVVTHAFRQWGGVVSAERTVTDAIREAQKNGIVFDVGHGGGSCSFDTIETALSQGFLSRHHQQRREHHQRGGAGLRSGHDHVEVPALRHPAGGRCAPQYAGPRREDGHRGRPRLPGSRHDSRCQHPLRRRRRLHVHGRRAEDDLR